MESALLSILYSLIYFFTHLNFRNRERILQKQINDLVKANLHMIDIMSELREQIEN